MAVHRPAQLTEHTPPPFRPHTPDPEHESKVFHHSPAARAQHAMKQLLFGDAKVKKHAVDERVHAMQQRDEESQVRVATPTGSANAKRDDGRRSPSLEAREADTDNQNGFGDEG